MAQDDLIGLYKEKAVYARIFDWLAGYSRPYSRTRVEQVQAGANVGRSDVTELFRSLDNLGYGRYVVGRRGSPSRFEWYKDMVSVARAARGEEESPKPITPDAHLEPSEDGCDDDLVVDQTVTEVEHPSMIAVDYPLRPSLLAQVRIPKDMTELEAKRLAEFVRTLYFRS